MQQLKDITGVRYRVQILIALAIAASAAASYANVASTKEQVTLRAGIRFDNPPHSFIDSRGNWVGFDIDIAEALAKAMGRDLQKVRVNELTRISFLQSDRIDVAIASMSHTIKRDREIDFSETYFWSKQTFLVKRGQIKRLKDLVGKRVGMDRGSSAIGNWRDWLKKHGHRRSPEIIEFTDKRAAVQAVKSGAIAGWAEDYEILASFAKRDGSLAVLAKEGIGVKLDGIGVKQGDSTMRDQVNYALGRLWASGRFRRIYNKWFGVESDTPVPMGGRIEVWPNG